MPLYNRGLLEVLGDARTSWDGSTDVRVLLLNSSHSFNPDHNFVSEVVAQEITVSGYARQASASRTLTELDATDRVVANMATTSFGALVTGQTIGSAVVYRHIGATDSANPLIAFIDLVDTPTNGGTFAVDWNDTDGVFYVDSPS